jgi:hypothetical protein
MSSGTSWKPSTVKLADGREVLSDSQEWKDECEARHVLNLPTKAERLELLKGIGKKRGTEAREALEARIMDLWRLGRAKGNV